MCMANFSNEILPQEYDLLQVSSQSLSEVGSGFFKRFASAC